LNTTKKSLERGRPMLLINDLSYLENVREDQLITGGTVVAILGASASAMGDKTLAYTRTDLDLKAKKNGGAKFKGRAIALAVGENPEADVDYYLLGFDKVKVKTIEKIGSNYDLEIVKIKAIDKPNK
jgi:hypothetical protein